MEKGIPAQLVRLFAKLAQPVERSGAVRELANLLQAEAILFFVRDQEIGTFLIAPGFNRTLPDGQVWQKFVSECSGQRLVEQRLPFPQKGSWTMATGLGWNRQAALIVMGSSPQRLEEVAELVPVLAVTLQTEHALAIHAAQSGLAHEVAQKSNALAKGLDNSRRAAQQEITARKQVEKALNILSDELKRANAELIQARDKAIAAVSAKDDFLAALSHELRTPLNPVLLIASEAAGNFALPDEVRADFEMISKNVGLEAG